MVTIVLGPSSPGSPILMSTSGSGSLESVIGKLSEGGRQVRELRAGTQTGGSSLFLPPRPNNSIDKDERINWTGSALQAFYAAVRKALVVVVVLRALGILAFLGLSGWLMWR